MRLILIQKKHAVLLNLSISPLNILPSRHSWRWFSRSVITHHQKKKIQLFFLSFLRAVVVLLLLISFSRQNSFCDFLFVEIFWRSASKIITSKVRLRHFEHCSFSMSFISGHFLRMFFLGFFFKIKSSIRSNNFGTTRRTTKQASG